MISAQWKKKLTRLFKLRFAVLYPLGIWAVLAAAPTDLSLRQSAWLILLGLAVRSWANGYAIKMEKLTTCGPYAYVRNPLYLGSFLIMAGFLMMLNVSWVWMAFCLTVVIGIIYGATVSKEEAMLSAKFGEVYLDYKKKVPAFFPTVFRYARGEKWGWSFVRYFKSQEYKLFLWMIILVIAFHLKTEFIVEREWFDGKIIFLIILAVLLGLTDVIGSAWRKAFFKQGAVHL